jgi:hypothetical protein
MTKWNVIPLEEPPKKPETTAWSVGLAMFAAFVMPFVLLMISARYQGFVARSIDRMSEVDSWGVGKFRFSRPANVVRPATTDTSAPGNAPAPQPAETHE